jgi:hypothetical protein
MKIFELAGVALVIDEILIYLLFLQLIVHRG